MTTPASYTKICPSCGSVITLFAEVCPRCGVRQPDLRAVPGLPGYSSEKRILPAAILAFLFGVFGVHRFYVGKVGTGILQLVTLGGLGIWALVDFILIVCGAFKDADGNRITQWV